MKQLTKEELLDLAKRKFDLNNQCHKIEKDFNGKHYPSPEWAEVSERLRPLRSEVNHINDVLAIHGIGKDKPER